MSVYWITGLSGAGKTTLCNRYVEYLRDRSRVVVMLDGDELREVLGVVNSLSVAERKQVAFCYARLCLLLALQGFDVAIATISLFKDVHAWNRQYLPGYREIYISVPLDELSRRDTKSIYARAASGEISDVAGVNFAIDEPESPDVVIKWHEGLSVDEAFQQMKTSLDLLENSEMKTEWDYSGLADAYLLRPDYADVAIDAMLKIASVQQGATVCDVGAGVAHLTLMLTRRGHGVSAVEPNDAMRANGIKRTAEFGQVTWSEGVGERTGQPDRSFELVTFGSSFNVCDRPVALTEVSRILKPGGWFACMWNHRDLNDPIQHEIESIIGRHIAGYNYGSRREDQTAVINQSGLYGPVVRVAGDVEHEQTIADVVEAWRSHATLARQAGDQMAAIVSGIERYLTGLNQSSIKVPYTTHIWMAQLK